MLVRHYTKNDADNWDQFCDTSLNATFLHKQKYIGYHKDRFIDESLIITDKNNKWLGVFPAARDPDDESCVVSHPGLTYGGILHTGKLIGERMLDAFDKIEDHYIREGYSKLIYKAIPNIYHRYPAQDDLYALFRKSANRYRCDLSSSINLKHRLQESKRRRRATRNARENDINVIEDYSNVDSLWQVLRENLKKKHNAEPVHSEAEIKLLKEKFPDNIIIFTAWSKKELLAGVVIYIAGPVHHAQYIASSDHGKEVNALDLVFHKCIEVANNLGSTWFDFGVSNEQKGMYLNEGLYKFKSEFGGGGVAHEFYSLDLCRG